MAHGIFVCGFAVVLVAGALVFRDVFFAIEFDCFGDSFYDFALADDGFRLFDFFVEGDRFCRAVVAFAYVFGPDFGRFFVTSFDEEWLRWVVFVAEGSFVVGLVGVVRRVF